MGQKSDEGLNMKRSWEREAYQKNYKSQKRDNESSLKFRLFTLLKREQKEQKSVTVENSNQNKMAATK